MVFDTVTLGDVGAAAVGGIVGGLAVDFLVPGASNLFLAGGVVGGTVAGLGVKRGAEKAYDWVSTEEGVSPILLEMRQMGANFDARLSANEQAANAYLAAEAKKAEKIENERKATLAANVERQMAAERAERAQAAKDEREERTAMLRALAQIGAALGGSGKSEESATAAGMKAAS